jgi:hypothetical protein
MSQIACGNKKHNDINKKYTSKYNTRSLAKLHTHPAFRRHGKSYAVTTRGVKAKSRLQENDTYPFTVEDTLRRWAPLQGLAEERRQTAGQEI